MSARRIPVTVQRRLVVDNDWAADPDGLLALVHHLLAEAAVVRAITGTAILTVAGPVADGDPARDLAEETLRRVGVTDPPPVSSDARIPFAELSEPTDGARLILEESRRDDPLPLTIVCGGPLTNVASALAADPALADRADLVWIGGGEYPGGAWEYNLVSDLPAARFVFEDSRIPITQVPQPAYRQCAMSLAEMADGLLSAGGLGEWLYDRFTAPPDWVRLAGVWPMGDSPPVLITALGTESSAFRTVETPRIADDGSYLPSIGGRPLTLCDAVDVRLLFADFFARLRVHERSLAS